MIKFTLKLLLPLLLVISNSAFAGLITTELTKDTYITYQGYDWTWASTVNTTLYTDSIFGHPADTPAPEENRFEDASFHDGWMEITNSANHPNLLALFSELLLSDFTNKDSGALIHSLSYWNSIYTDVNPDDFNYRSGAKNDEFDSFTMNFDTFYVRASLPEAAQVPEPTTLFIFAAGLVGFALRKRNAK